MLRRKIDGLQMACDGRFTAGHGQMCRLHLDAYDHLTVKIAEVDVLVAEAAAPFQPVIARLVTIPGIGQRVAEVIVAETGGDMARFAPPAAGRTGRAGAGDNESAGKRKRAAARPGNRHLRTALVESAWSTARTRSRPSARFRRLARRVGRGNEKKAAVAVAHTLACIAWAIMKNDQDYAEAGEDCYERVDQRNRDHIVRHHQQALARLGYLVTPRSTRRRQTAASTSCMTLRQLTGEPITAGSAGAAARPLGPPSFVTGRWYGNRPVRNDVPAGLPG